MATEEEIEKIVEKAFELYDEDCRHLEKDEIRRLLDEACEELGKDQITEEELDAVLQTVGGGDDVKFSFDEVFHVAVPLLRKNSD